MRGPRLTRATWGGWGWGVGCVAGPARGGGGAGGGGTGPVLELRAALQAERVRHQPAARGVQYLPMNLRDRM